MSTRIRLCAVGVLLVVTGSCGGGGDGPSEPEPQVQAGGSVSGSVLNGTAGVPGATLTLSGVGLSRTATSAQTGAYSFTNVNAGAYTVSIAAPAGFTLAAAEQAVKTVTVSAGATATADFALTAATTGGNTVTIDIQGLTFTPREVTVPLGTRIRWTNNSGMFHTVTPDGHSQWSSADLNHGAVFEVVLGAVGTFNYFCTPHRGDGMSGTIRVQ